MEDESKKPRGRQFTARTGLAVELWEQPEAQDVSMVAGWRQWADAGSVSSGLPKYLAQQLAARAIGQINPDGFYIFQIPGTHDLLRPIVEFDRGYPQEIHTSRNEVLYAGDQHRGLVIFIGDEPHLDIERYTASFFHIARTLNVRRIFSLGGVYGELPFDRERSIHGIISRPEMRAQLERLAISPSEYHGGASIGSYLCRRAGDAGIEMMGLYAFVPTYDFTNAVPAGGMIRIENDFTAWLGIMRRLNHVLSVQTDLSDLEGRSAQLQDVMRAKMDEIDSSAPHLGVKEYLIRLAEEFEEKTFHPDDDFWEEKLRGLFDDADGRIT